MIESVQKIWNLSPPSSLAPELSRETGLSLLQAQLLINRGISDPPHVDSFLHSRLANMADPMLLKDMDMALGIVLKAVENKEKITIYGDYDADGLTATAVLLNFFSGLGVPVAFHIPNRLKEGYGLNEEAVYKIAENGTALIITVDCGISNAKEIALAKSLGMNVVVTDHHQVPDGFQSEFPVINPHQPGCCFPFKDLAGVGLAFFLAVAIRGALREAGWFGTRPEPDLKKYLDLVALGTVADRVPLLDQNRILVNSGLQAMARTRWAGIRALKEVADISTSEVTSDDLAFRLAPRLNAPGRMGDPGIGIEVLTVEESLLARDLALRINETNTRRRHEEGYILDEIEALINTMGAIDDHRILVLAGENWHQGVLGIVASRLVDRYHRPSLVLNIKDGLATGSGRSIEGFNLYRALSKVGHVFEKFGGHAYAAGFSLKAKNIEILKRELEGIAGSLEFGLSDEDLIPRIDVDAEVSLRDITPDTIHEIKELSPFGAGNPEPLFLASSLEVVESRVVGGRHLKLRVRQEGVTFEAIGFGLSERHLAGGRTINMVFTPEMNYWNGYETIQLRIADIITS